MDAARAVSTLSALAVFASTVDHGAVRSVHGYKVRVVGKGRTGGWDKWVEREFLFAPNNYREVPAPFSLPRILPAEWRGRPVYREGQMVGPWRCILAFDSVAGVAPPPTPPTMLDATVNPRVMCVRYLYNDLEQLFPYRRNVQKVPGPIQRDARKDKTSGDVGPSGYDFDEDTESGEDLPAEVQKQRRANKHHIASITLADISQYFNLPIREASASLKVGVSILKRKCRQYGIPRWPHRKIKSLDSLIHDIEYVIDDTERDDVQQEKHKQEKQIQKEKKEKDAVSMLAKRKILLETEKETIQQKPATDLMAETKQFREDVFKRRYRAKNLGLGNNQTQH